MDTGRVDNGLTRDEPAVEPDAPSAEDDLVPPVLVNRYAVPLSTLMGGAVVSQSEHVIIQPVPENQPTAGGANSGFGAAGDGD